MKKQLALFSALCLALGTPAVYQGLPSVGFTASAQTSKATGTVTDENGEPMVGVSVVEKGSKTGVTTDLDGKFTIQAKPGSTIVFSYVGYSPKEVKFKGTAINVQLLPNAEVLSDVVVVGYATQRREHLTGAVSTVDVAKTLEGRQIADVGRGLQGTTPGLNVVLPNGEIGSDPTIRIRGQVASLNGSANPLILLDNVEIPSIQLVNPDDIESISVLKDAAAASIYGSKAAFGVILIQTKKGAKTDRVDVSYSGNFAWQRISKDMEMATVDATQYRVDEMERMGSTIRGAFWYVDQEALARQREWVEKYDGKIGVDDPFVYGRDWFVNSDGRKMFIRPYDPYDYMIRDWAPSMTHNVSVNGKSGKTSFNIGLGYLDQNGLIKPSKVDDYRRYNASANITTELNKWVTLRAGLKYSMRNKRYGYATNSTTADPWLYLYRWDAFAPHGLDENGNMLRSPSTEMAQANTANRENDYTSINAGFTLNLTENWHVNLDYAFAAEDQHINKPGTRFTQSNTWGSAIARYDANGERVYVNHAGEVCSPTDPEAQPAYDLPILETDRGSNPDHIRRESTHAKRHTLNVTMDYDWKINENNNLKAMVGLNRTDWESKDHWSQITYLTDIHNPSFDKTNGTQTASGNDYWDGQLGVFGRINYALFDRYLLEANIRYDGSSKFPKGMKWRAFPSVSAGWRLDQESFMKWAQPALSNAKLRVSWGSIGDQSVSSNLYIPTMSQSQINWIDANDNKFVGVGAPAAVAGDITWQVIETTNVGIDARFFNNEFGLSFDWYQRNTKNMLIPAEGIPTTFGAAAPTGNYGDLRTRGWELALDYNHAFNKDLSINATFTLSDARSTITKYGKTEVISGWYAGKEYGEIWGYEVDRLYQKDDFLYNPDGSFQTVWVKQGKEVAEGVEGAKLMNKLADPNAVYPDYFQTGSAMFGPGDIKYKDLNGDGEMYIGNRTMIELDGKTYVEGDPGYEAALADPDHEVVPVNTVRNHGDLKKIGNSTPRFEYGLRLGVNYKGFDFSIFGQGIGSRKIWGAGFLALPGFNTGDGAMPQTIAGDYWREDRTDAFYPRAYNLGGENSGGLFQVSDRYLLNMAYFRIKNITLGYTLPTELTRKALINKCRVYVSAENFFTFDKLNGLPIDPEVVSGVSMWNSSNYNSGRTGVGTPAMKNINFGIQLNF